MPQNLTMFAYSQGVKEQVTEEELKKISGLYSDWADEVGDLASYYHHKETASSVLSEQYYRQLQAQMVETSKQVSNEVYGIAKGGMLTVSDAVVKDAVDWAASLGFDKGQMSQAFSYVPDSVVRSLATGQVYESGWSLSKSIWGDNEKTLRDIYTIVAEGRAKQEGVYETAKRLEAYVNPNRALPWTGPTVIGPDGKPYTMRIYKHAVDYNAQRLVRTLNQHTYQQSIVETSKDNPFVLRFMWQANGSRVCPLCLDRDGTEYEKDKLPLDHPNGMCIMVPVTMDKDEMLQKLADWVNGEDGDYPDIDKFAKGVGYEGKPMTTKQFLDKYGPTDMKYYKSWYNKLDDAGKSAYDKMVAASSEDPAMFFKKFISSAYDDAGKKVVPKPSYTGHDIAKKFIGDSYSTTSPLYNDVYKKFGMDAAEDFKALIHDEKVSGGYQYNIDVWKAYMNGTAPKAFTQTMDDFFKYHGASMYEKDLAKQAALDAAKKKAAQEAKQYAKQHGIISTPDGFDKLYQEQQRHLRTVRKQGREWVATLSSAERDGVTTYSGGSYREMNNYLRGRSSSISPRLQTAIDNAHSALSGTSTTQELYLVRGTGSRSTASMMGASNWQEVLDNPKRFVGAKMTDEGFFSTSPFGGEFGGEVHMHITAPAGVHGAYIESISLHSTEKEFLFDKGQSFIVTNIVPGRWSTDVYMTAIV